MVGDLEPWELVLYPPLCLSAGWLGGVLGRAATARREAFFRASQQISTAQSPRDIAAAIGEHLGGSKPRQVALWRVIPTTGEELTEVELLASWTPQGEEVLPPGRRMNASDVPVLNRLKSQSAAVTRVSALPPAGREPWKREGLRCVALVPLSAAGDGPDGLLTVVSREGEASLRRRTRSYPTISAQATLALENLRLVEAPRRAGVLGERQRLAFEVHDTLVQGFSSIVMNLETAEESLVPDPGTTHKHLDRARNIARESLREARRLVWALSSRSRWRKPRSPKLCNASPPAGPPKARRRLA